MQPPTPKSNSVISLPITPRAYGMLEKKRKLVNQAIISLEQLISKPFQNLDVGVNVVQKPQDPTFFEVILSGRDAAIVQNFVRKTFGVKTPFLDLEPGQEVIGYLRDVGQVGFGAFLDCGITAPEKDMLLPLVTLREQLTNDISLPARDILQAFGLGTHVPLRVKITQVDSRKKQIEGRLTALQAQELQAYLTQSVELINVCGVTRQYLKRQISKAGHAQDVVEVARLGWLENQIVCKEGTTAPGLIARLGPRLTGVEMYAIRPANLRRLIEATE